MPVAFTMIYAMISYRIRMNSYEEGDLLYHAHKSQQHLKYNSGKTLTYCDTMNSVGNELDIELDSETLVSRHEIREKLKIAYHKIFHQGLTELRVNPSTKLNIYSLIKANWGFESYLSLTPHAKYICKFRLSDHLLPIERMRHIKPYIPREQRFCSLCGIGIGDELHALFKCSSGQVS